MSQAAGKYPPLPHGVFPLTPHSPATQSRAKACSINLVDTDTDLVSQSDYIFSIVPPVDAKATADRIIKAYNALPPRTSLSPLYYLDLNAIAPSTARTTAASFASLAKDVRMVDGGIIGGPPKLNTENEWEKPSICLSGPHPLASAPKAGSILASLLNTRHVSDSIGTASGLKCCFASMTKGATALAIQSFSTASALGVLPALQDYVGLHAPSRLAATQRGLTGMPPKAGRWVDEMREIGKTFSEDGGWGGANIFGQVAEVYEFVAGGTELGKEHVDSRKRGRTVEDVVAAIGEGMERKKRKGEEK